MDPYSQAETRRGIRGVRHPRLIFSRRDKTRPTSDRPIRCMGTKWEKKLVDGYAKKCGSKLLKSSTQRVILHFLMFALIDHSISHIQGILRELTK